ncbi:uncharacterized protein LOC109711893 [Ananas comosus]|uniref:Uncharacterized protein LOC109711893 n=1 Tax=Ananas comosus TaxID=4615 RepID=A0A199W8W6_ANACO|nr:uncharacterized protein LOC109711893 [Ananas comosus]OAY85676.1 hypothetical protein ACMD2_17716 [Ananas comosus]
MAIYTCSFPMILMIPKGQNYKIITRSTAIRTRHVQVLRASVPLKKFSMVSKIFEDREQGMVCYRDEEGELICEGYDEGPRYEERSPEAYCESRSRQAEAASCDSVRPTRLQIFGEDVDVCRLAGKQEEMI